MCSEVLIDIETILLVIFGNQKYYSIYKKTDKKSDKIKSNQNNSIIHNNTNNSNEIDESTLSVNSLLLQKFIRFIIFIIIVMSGCLHISRITSNIMNFNGKLLHFSLNFLPFLCVYFILILFLNDFYFFYTNF